MHTYRIELELRSGLGTPLAAETLWGHIAWGLRYRHGNQSLEAWLARYDQGDPPLVLSDPLPRGYFPRPEIPPAPRPEQPPTVEEADQRKRLDKRRWVSHAAWREICDGLSPQSVEQAVARSPTPPAPAEAAVTRAGINRLTGGTAQAEGGTLFTGEQHYFDFCHPPRFDIWVLSPEPPETLSQWFSDGLSGGYGRDASAGLGHLVVTEPVHEMPLPAPANPTACILLGPTVPRAGDPHRGFFNFGVRCGRLGGDFAIGELPGNASGRHKRPVRCLLAGTVLLRDGDLPRWVGRVLRNAHPQIEAIRHYGIAPVLPCRLVPELLSHPMIAVPDAEVRSGVSANEDSPA